MAKAGLSFENPLYAASGGVPAGFANPYTGLNPAASSGGDALQRGLADMAVMGQAARTQFETQFSMPGMATPATPPQADVLFSPSTRKFYVNGITFDEDDDAALLQSESLLGQPSVGRPQGGDWTPVPVSTYQGFIEEVKRPSLGQLASKSFGRGVDQLQMLAGRGLQLAGAEQLGAGVVAQQEADLAKTAPYERQFTDIESGRGAIEWFVANLAQQGPNLLESVAVGLAGAAAGTAAAGPGLGTAAGAVAGFFGKKAFKDKVMSAATKYRAGAATPDDLAILKNASAMTGAVAASYASNMALGASDIYGEMREQGVGPEDAGARMTALAGSLPYAAMESLSEFLVASRVLGGGGRAALGAGATRGQRAAEYGKRFGIGFGAGGLAEGTTELGQEGLVMGLSGQDLGSDEAVNRFINAFAAGAAIGGPIGGVANLKSRNPDGTPSAEAKEEVNLLTPSTDLVPVEGTGFTGFPRGGYTPAPPGTAVAPFFTPVTPVTPMGAAPTAPLGLPGPVAPVTPVGGSVILAGMGPDAASVTRQDLLLRQQGNVPPGAAPGSQGVLDIFGGTIPAQELAARMQPQQPLPGLPASTPAVQPDPRQGALQFAGPAPVAPANTQMANQLQVIQDRLRRQREFDAAQAQQQAAIQQQTEALAQQSANARLLYTMQQAEQQAAAQPPMPMRPAAPVAPTQLPLFPRGLPRPSRREKEQAAQPLPTVPPTPPREAPAQPAVGVDRAELIQERRLLQATVDGYRAKGTNRVTATIRDNALKRIKEIDKQLAEMPAADLGPLFTAEGEPTMAALKASGTKTKVKQPTPKPAAKTTRGARGLKKGAKVAEVTVKEAPSAVQKPSAKKVPARKQPEAGAGVGAEVPAKPKAAAKGEALKAKKQEPAVQENVVVSLADRLGKKIADDAMAKAIKQEIDLLLQQLLDPNIQNRMTTADLDRLREITGSDNLRRAAFELNRLLNDIKSRPATDIQVAPPTQVLKRGKAKEEPKPPKAEAAPAAALTADEQYAQDVTEAYNKLTDTQKAAVAAELNMQADTFNVADAVGTLEETTVVDDAIAAVKRREKEAARRAPQEAKAALAEETPQVRWDAFALPGMPNYVDLPQPVKDAWEASDRSEAMQITIVENIFFEEYAISPAEAFNFSVAVTESARAAGDLTMMQEALGMPDGILDSALFAPPGPNTNTRIAEAQAFLDTFTPTSNEQSAFKEAFITAATRKLNREAFTKGANKSPKQWFTLATNLGVLRQLTDADMQFLGLPQDVAQTLLDEGKITLNNLPDSMVKALGKNKPTTEQAAGVAPQRSEAVKLAEKIRDLNKSTTDLSSTARTKVINDLTALWQKVRDANLDTTQPDALLGVPLGTYFDADGKPITNIIDGKLRVGTKKLSKAEITTLETQMRAERDARKRITERGEIPTLDDYDDDGAFFTSDGKPIKAPVNVGRIRMAVNRFLAKLSVKPTVTLYKNQADLKARNPELYAQAAAARPQGDFDTANAVGYSFGKGNVVIFTDRIATEDMLNFVLAHETLGHFGLRGLIPAKQFDALMESIYDQSQTVRDAVDAATMTRKMPKAEAVEEYLADAAAILDTSLINRIFNTIKNALNKLGVKFADDAARYWVNQARRYVRHGERPSVLVTSEVMRRINDVEGGLDPDGTGRFALAGTLRGDNMLYEFAQPMNGMPESLADAAKKVRDAVGDSANSAEKFKTKFFSLLNFRARENPGLAALEEVLSQGRAFAMSIKNAANEKMAPILDRAIASFAAGWAGVGGVTEAQTEQVNKMLYDAQRYATAKLVMSDLTKTPLFTVASDGTVVPNEAEFDRVYRMGLLRFEQARDGYSYDVTYLEGGEEVTETVTVAGDPNLDENGVVWQGYLRTREAMRDTHEKLLRATYASFTADRDLALREIGDATVAKKLTSNDQKFLEQMYRKYRDLYTADKLVDEEGNPAFNPESMTKANDFIVAVNKAILANETDLNAAVTEFFDAAKADDIFQSIEDFKKNFVKSEENKFIVQNKLKQIVLEDIANNDADLATKVTLARGYTPLLRKGQYQTRVVALDSSGREVRLKPGYREQLVFSQFEKESDALNFAEELNKTFGTTTYEVEAYNEDQRKYVPMQVQLKTRAEAALSEVAAPPELNLNEFIRGLRQFSIVLTPAKMKEVILATTRQNNSARNRLLRAFTPGASPDALSAISKHIEERASIAAKVLMRPRINELMNLNMSSTQKLWNGDKAKLDQLKANYERIMADSTTTDAERRFAQGEYDMYNMQYQKTNPQGKAARGNLYYDEGSRAVAFLNDNRDVNDSDFGSGETASAIRAGTSLLQLGASIATASLNYVGAYINGIAFLATYNNNTAFGGGFGFGPGITAYQRALSQVGLIKALPGVGQKGLNTAEFYEDMVGKPDVLKQYGLTESEARFLAREIREGVMIPALSNSLMSSARGRMPYAGAQKAVDAIMWTFNSSEQAVRRALGLAAYRLQYERSRAAGRTEADAASDARDFAVSTLNYTVGEYSVMNRPAVWRSGIQSFLYMYKVFPTTTIQLLARLPRQGQVYMLMGLFMLGGLTAFPFAEDIEDLIDTISQALGWKSGSIRVEIAKVVDQLVPGASPYFLRGFANPLLGAEIASRISSGDFVPGTGMFLSGADKGREAFEILGPAASMLEGVGAFATRLTQSAFTEKVTFVDALRESPMTMMRAFGDAISYGQAGAVVDKRGYIVAPDAHAGIIAARMLGFYPSAASEQYQIIRASKRLIDYQRETTAGFRAAWIKAKLSGDEDQARAVVDSVRDWNEGTKGTALEIRNFLANSQRALREAQRPTKERLLRAAPKAAKDDLEQVADLLGYND
jgi:hypothetical protein